ncbi:MAG: hypothetical protein Q7S87_08615 [Agitococcus sp.]|nr:hypothetical protein [Agitococcus sp.]MDO9177632.1 hypothetical protein [Agitococcus sp.]
MKNSANRRVQQRLAKSAHRLLTLATQRSPLSPSEKVELIALRHYTKKLSNASIRFERRYCGRTGIPKSPSLCRMQFSLMTKMKRVQKAQGSAQAITFVMNVLIPKE